MRPPARRLAQHPDSDPHVPRDRQTTGRAPYPDLYVPKRAFTDQMRGLAARGFHVVTLQEAYDYWHGAPLPSKPVVVSFDDGFRNHYTAAYPILAQFGWSGTLNLAISHLHEGSYGLNRREVAAMIRGGWEIDSHTMTHADLPGLSESQLWREVAGSRTYLRRTFAIPVNFLAYPFGAYSSSVIASTIRAGYAGATTTNTGWATPTSPYTLPPHSCHRWYERPGAGRADSAPRPLADRGSPATRARPSPDRTRPSCALGGAQRISAGRTLCPLGTRTEAAIAPAGIDRPRGLYSADRAVGYGQRCGGSGSGRDSGVLDRRRARLRFHA